MTNQLTEMLIEEIRENRKEIKSIHDKLHELDKHVFSNKVKLSLFISGVSLFFSMAWAMLFEKVKHIL